MIFFSTFFSLLWLPAFFFQYKVQLFERWENKNKYQINVHKARNATVKCTKKNFFRMKMKKDRNLQSNDFFLPCVTYWSQNWGENLVVIEIEHLWIIAFFAAQPISQILDLIKKWAKLQIYDIVAIYINVWHPVIPLQIPHFSLIPSYFIARISSSSKEWLLLLLLLLYFENKKTHVWIPHIFLDWFTFLDSYLEKKKFRAVHFIMVIKSPLDKEVIHHFA